MNKVKNSRSGLSTVLALCWLNIKIFWFHLLYCAGFRDHYREPAPLRPMWSGCKGVLEMNYHGNKIHVYGGPFRAGYDHGFAVTVNMAKELDSLPSTIAIPTQDFSVPNMEVFNAGIISFFEKAQFQGEAYVGCMGGIGRTGLFMAGCMIYLGTPAEEAIKFIRKHYFSHAVETEQQCNYLHTYQIACGNKAPFNIDNL